MSGKRHRYRIYDLIMESDVELALADANAEYHGDVWQFEQGPVDPPQGRCIHDVLDFDGKRRLEVFEDGDQGLIFSHGDTRIAWRSSDRRVRMQVGDDLTLRPGIVLERVAAPIALILERREFVALHASAVGDGDGNAFVFVGNSGAGKSTTALELMRRGMELLADDLVMIDGASMRLLSAMASVRLFDRPEAVPEALDEELVMPEIEKYWYRLPHRDDETPESHLRQIFLLDPQPEVDEARVEPLRGREATVAVIAQAFDLTEATGPWREGRFRTLCRLVRELPVFRVVYGRSDREDPRQVEAIAQHLRRLGAL